MPLDKNPLTYETVENNIKDTFFTIQEASTGLFRDRGSKFLAYAYPVNSEKEAMARVELQRSEHPKARHHCFAYRLGMDGNRFRANDDGEPGGTAGRPILGQIDRCKLTNVVIVVVRYFGGTKLGASGLIQAYKTSAADALENAKVVEKIIKNIFEFRFGYDRMGDVMSAIERSGVEMISQHFDHTARLCIAIRKSEVQTRITALKALMAGISLDQASQLDHIDGISITEMSPPPEN